MKRTNETTLNREFFEKAIIALHEVPDGILQGILEKKKMRITLEYDPQKNYIEIFKVYIGSQDDQECQERNERGALDHPN